MIPWMLTRASRACTLWSGRRVDIARIRRAYPGFLMMGGYDKMVMWKAVAAMRAEFERIASDAIRGLCPVSRSPDATSGVASRLPRIPTSSG